MLASAIGKVVEVGASWATVAWVGHRRMEEVFRRCAAGESRWQRLGVASVLADFAADDRMASADLECLAGLLDDPVEEVRNAASMCVTRPGFLGRPGAEGFARRFVASAAFDQNFAKLIVGLENLTKPLVPFAPTLVEVAGRLGGPHSRGWHEASRLSKILLRLYGQSDGDDKSRSACLDAFDRLLGRGHGREALGEVDE